MVLQMWEAKPEIPAVLNRLFQL